jgi:hypothetical protein
VAVTTGVGVMVCRLPSNWRALVAERFIATARDGRGPICHDLQSMSVTQFPWHQMPGRTLRVADGAVDMARNRFGREAIGYRSVALGLSCSVPNEFRELAEREL